MAIALSSTLASSRMISQRRPILSCVGARRMALPLPVRRLAPCSAAETPASALTSAKPGQEYMEFDKEFAISKVSFGSILTPVGSFLLVFGFGAYFQLWGGGDLSSLALIYGFPMALLGFALFYAQVGCMDAGMHVSSGTACMRHVS